MVIPLGNLADADARHRACEHIRSFALVGARGHGGIQRRCMDVMKEKGVSVHLLARL